MPLLQGCDFNLNTNFVITGQGLRSRQQYQRLETKGNPRLDTLKLIDQGLNSEVLLIPREKLTAVLTLLENNDARITSSQTQSAYATKEQPLINSPWKGLLEDEDDNGS
ncbi:hypothetical protein [Marinomonas sp.]|uniref:hypothetical protein n=1 Tax=Marinomonas sp. TaxID=1904862 RepID=UPI003BA9C0C4